MSKDEWIEWDGPFPKRPKDARPMGAGHLMKICPGDKHKRKKGLNFKEDSVFRGICKFGPAMLIACYGPISFETEEYNVHDFAWECSQCPYCTAGKLSDPYYKPMFEAAFVYKYLDEYDLLEWDDPRYYVYFISDGSAVKIGISNNVEKRMNHIQTGNPRPIELLYLIPCASEKTARRVEVWMHNMYSLYRKQGEWFDILDKLYPDWDYYFPASGENKKEDEANE